MTSSAAGPPSGTHAEKNDGANPAPAGRSDSAGGTDESVVLTATQKRRAAREARRQAKDALYALRQDRKRAKDGTSWHGHHIVNAEGLADAFPPLETTEIEPVTVRRRILHGAILVTLVALLVAGLVLASMVQRGELELKIGSWKPAPTPVACPAGQVAQELKKRGFLVKDIANKDSDYAAPAVEVSGANGHSAALTLQQNFPDSDYVQDATVDVIVTATTLPWSRNQKWTRNPVSSPVRA